MAKVTTESRGRQPAKKTAGTKKVGDAKSPGKVPSKNVPPPQAWELGKSVKCARDESK